MDAPTAPIRRYDATALAEAARVVLTGGIVAVPTETVYGLAADAGDACAVARIYAAKGRPAFNPLIVHVPDLAAAERLAVFDAPARALAAAFWPGPLTLVLPARADAGLAPPVTAGLPTVALRVPAQRAMRGLLEATGRALAAPSANRSNAISPTRAEHVAASLGARVPLILDDGPCAAGLESTIVAGRVILRHGPITEAMIAGVIGQVEVGRREGVITAPGQLATHYAPNKPLRLDATEARAGEWLIGFGAVGGDDNLSPGGDPTEAAARLFDALHRADASASAQIAVAPVPEEGVGVAINDRMRRAAGLRAGHGR